MYVFSQEFGKWIYLQIHTVPSYSSYYYYNKNTKRRHIKKHNFISSVPAEKFSISASYSILTVENKDQYRGMHINIYAASVIPILHMILLFNFTFTGVAFNAFI